MKYYTLPAGVDGPQNRTGADDTYCSDGAFIVPLDRLTADSRAYIRDRARWDAAPWKITDYFLKRMAILNASDGSGVVRYNYAPHNDDDHSFSFTFKSNFGDEIYLAKEYCVAFRIASVLSIPNSPEYFMLDDEEEPFGLLMKMNPVNGVRP